MTPEPRVEAGDFSGVHVLVDDDPRWGADPVAQARRALAGGAPVIQLRAKHATDSQILSWARAIRGETEQHGARFVVNDRFDLALAAGACAVHLGQEDLSPIDIPEAARRRLAIGRSTHTREQVEAVVGERVDYLAFGPLFGTTSKQSVYPEQGFERLRDAVRAAAGIPVIAIGGILAAAIPALRASGVSGFAVISAVAGADDPTAAARQLCDAWASS